MKTGAAVWDRGTMYKAVAQLVILYGREIWMVTGAMLKVLEVFHHQAAMWITGMMVTHGLGREWEYPLVVAALKAVGIHPIMEYIRSQQATMEEKMVCQPIYEICVEADWRPGKIRRMRWWDQDVGYEPVE